MANIVVVSAHPDDMEIGMGGTVAKLSEHGFAITSVVLTDGRRSPNPFSWSEDQMATIRKKEAQEAAAVLGVSEILFCNLPDLSAKEHCDLAMQRIEETVRRLRPAEIFTLHPGLDRHPTHRTAGRLTQEVIKERTSHPTLWAYEVWGLFAIWNRIEDVGAQMSRKLLAIERHRSQTASLPYGEAVCGLNRWRAVFADPNASEPVAAYAEVFLALG